MIVQLKRLLLLSVLVGTGLVGLCFRLVVLQVWRHEELGQAAQRNTRSTVVRQPLRGQIRDSRGNLLAHSIPVKTVCADPVLLGKHGLEVARVLAPLLQTNEAYLVERFTPRIREDGTTNRFVILKHKVSVETWQQVTQTMMQLPLAGINEAKLKPLEKGFYRALHRKSIFDLDDQKRIYPNDQLAAHVIGYVSEKDKTRGENGVEARFNPQLEGVRGWLRTEVDNHKRELVAYRDQDVEPRDGLNVVLTLDAGLQHIVETELFEAVRKHNPISISATVVRPKTGEILAMATLPTYDPNFPGRTPMDHLRNRVISDLAEPGSTFKIVVVSAALQERLVNLTDMIDCEWGSFYYGGRILHDHEHYGLLPVMGVITKSSNIGSAKIGLKLGEERLYNYIRSFGFGTRTGIPLPAEVNGLLHPTKSWSKVSIVQIPMGHGMAATPLQMVMAMSAIANKGRLMSPMLVKRLEDGEGRIVADCIPRMVREAVGEEAARQMVEALKSVVSSDGTAVKARMEHYTVAGKTGTAQKVVDGRYVRKYFSSFIGFFPADNPELCISVVMDEPKNGYYGGQTAAPFFHNIAERAASYLNLKPEILPEAVGKETLAASTEALNRARVERKF